MLLKGAPFRYYRHHINILHLLNALRTHCNQHLEQDAKGHFLGFFFMSSGLLEIYALHVYAIVK